jgi:hypothetical protein
MYKFSVIFLILFIGINYGAAFYKEVISLGNKKYYLADIISVSWLSPCNLFYVNVKINDIIQTFFKH